MEATVWHPTNARELFYWFWIGGEAVRTVIEQKKTSGSVARLLPAGNVAVSYSISSQTSDENDLSNWVGKLDGLSRLAPGWNRQDAPAPSIQAIQGARQVIEAMVRDRQPPTRIAASAVGGVGVTRKVGDRMAYIEFYNDGAACALLADDAGDERVIDVPPTRESIENLLEEMKAYLDG
jgi:hypothetical protein